MGIWIAFSIQLWLGPSLLGCFWKEFKSILGDLGEDLQCNFASCLIDWALLMRGGGRCLGEARSKRWHELVTAYPWKALQTTSDYPQRVSFLMKKWCWPAGRVTAKFQDRFPGLYSGKMWSRWVAIRITLFLASQHVFTPHIPLFKYSPYWRTDAAKLRLTPSSLAFCSWKLGWILPRHVQRSACLFVSTGLYKETCAALLKLNPSPGLSGLS